MEQAPLYQFGRFVLDVDNRILKMGSKRIHLCPKAFDILSLLVSEAGRTVAKYEFLDKVWTDAHVEESNITQHIASLRKALGDTPRAAHSRYIETVSQKGYRFVAAVREKPRPQNWTTDGGALGVVAGGTRWDIEATAQPDVECVQLRRGSDECLEGLSEVERVILWMIGEQKTSGQIADLLCVSLRTVENHRTRIREKLGLRGNNALLVFAVGCAFRSVRGIL